MTTNNPIEFYCVSHTEPIFDIDSPFILVSPKINTEYPSVSAPDDYFGNLFHGNILSEYAQLFVLAEHLRSRSDLNSIRIFVFQYRKFLSLQPTSLQSSNNPWSFVTSSTEAKHYFPNQEALLTSNSNFLIGPIVNFGHSLSKGYAVSHIADDFVAFCISLRTHKNFSDERCEQFFRSEHLIPAPALSMQPANFFIYCMDVLREVWGNYCRRFYKAREGYQRRVGGFLLERLHSYLIYEHLVLLRRDTAAQGYQITVSGSEYITPTI